jgi:hypothetical protein
MTLPKTIRDARLGRGEASLRAHRQSMLLTSFNKHSC